MRLRNSHSSYLDTPGVTTRNSPSLLSLLTEVVSFPGAHFLNGHTHTLTHGTGVHQHHHSRGMLSAALLTLLLRHIPLCKGYLSKHVDDCLLGISPRF